MNMPPIKRAKRATPARAQFVACYYRVSTPDQDIESQRAGVESNAARLAPGVSVWEYSDVASAFGRIRVGRRRRVRQKREGWALLMADCERGEVCRVVVAEVSRIARDVEEGIQAINRLRDLDVPIYVVRGGFDTATARGREAINFALCQSEAEADWLSERTIAGQAKAGAGKPGRPAAIDNDGARRVVELRGCGWSWGGIASEIGATESSCRRAWERANAQSDTRKR
jgi:DNA invertase Pin-like site-specific DNA recombinase